MQRPTPEFLAARNISSSGSDLLKVPWALDANGQPVTPGEVSSSEGLRCPDPVCDSRLVLRAGSERVRHFAHLDEERCSHESVEHWAAKHLLAKVVLASQSQPGKRPLILRRCPECGKSPQPLPEAVKGARVEEAVDGFRADVLLFDGAQQPLCALEVLHTHAVTKAKAEGLSIPWIELAAGAVLASPLWWVPLREGLRPLQCDHAGTEYLRKKEEEARRIARILLAMSVAERCPFPLGPGEYFVEIAEPACRWWPMNAWRPQSMELAITELETRLQDTREFCRYFHPRSTVWVWIRAWDGTLVGGEWRDGRWFIRPSKEGVVEWHRRALLRERAGRVMPPIRRSRRF